MARPRKYATAAERQAAFRDRYAVFEIRLTTETAATLAKLADTLDVSRNEVVNSLINFALLNRNWFTLGLFGKRLPYAKNPLDNNPAAKPVSKMTPRQQIIEWCRRNGLKASGAGGAVSLSYEPSEWIETFDSWGDALAYLVLRQQEHWDGKRWPWEK